MKLFNLIRAFVICMWPASLFAAPAIQQSFESVPGIAWLVASGLSTLGGVTALMFRLEAQINQKDAPALEGSRLWIMVASQMLLSWLAGAIFFLLGLHWEMPIFLTGAVVAMASFGGAKSIEYAWNRILPQTPPSPPSQQ